ncbi:MAG: AraC family transcriptional regulator [Candidatus Ornithomonoglobus sp.]
MKKEPMFKSNKKFEIQYQGLTFGHDMKREHFHNTYELLYITNGSRRVSIAGNTYILNQGDMIVIEPYVKHQITRSGNAPYSRYLVNIDPEIFQGIYTKTEISAITSKIKTQILHFNVPSSIEEHFRKIHEKAASSNRIIAKLAVPQTAVMLFDTMSCCDITEIALDGTEKPKPDIIRALNYIDEHYAENISHEELCAFLHTSRASFYRQFTSTVGIPLKQYILHKKLIAATTLLADHKDIKISHVAEQCGFASHAAMTRLIKEVYGKTPKDIQKHGTA